jgi:hypothetical protein
MLPLKVLGQPVIGTRGHNMDTSSHKASPTSKLANLVQTQLPRELRDFIYSHLWTSEVVRALNYPNHIGSTNLTYGSLHNDPNGQNCLCERPNSIPPFAQTKFVGHEFAREAVEWLYNTCPFTLTSSLHIPKFVLQDAFHMGMTPSITSIRQLTLGLPLNARDSKRSARLLKKNLAALSELKVHRLFRLRVAFHYSEMNHFFGMNHEGYQIPLFSSSVSPARSFGGCTPSPSH